uniref:Uncharacterized protein n=1 Tax=Anguilla anguilla TaxID=7936 RepID=A0A0E9VFS2_ANGAN
MTSHRPHMDEVVDPPSSWKKEKKSLKRGGKREVEQCWKPGLVKGTLCVGKGEAYSNH